MEVILIRIASSKKFFVYKVVLGLRTVEREDCKV